jgi:hypothetical protein
MLCEMYEQEQGIFLGRDFVDGEIHFPVFADADNFSTS